MIRVLLALLFTIASANAQSAPTATIRVLCFERDPSGLDRLSVVTSDGKFEEIRFPETFPSRPAKVPLIEGKAFFFDPSKTDAPPVASATIPSGTKTAFVMFFPAPETEDGLLYRTVVLDASLDKIPEGGALVMNICEDDLRVIIGEHKLLLEEGKTAGVKRPAKRNDFNMASVVFLKQESENGKSRQRPPSVFLKVSNSFSLLFRIRNEKHIQIRAYDLSEY